jgi:microcystin-dependent protein
MSNPFLAEIRIFAGNFAPRGWALCDGQLMPISQNTALFSLLGTTYGGDGRSTFALPNLQGSAPMQAGQGPGLSLRDLGETGGEQTVTLLDSEMPNHNHTFVGTTANGTVTSSNGNQLGKGLKGNIQASNSIHMYSAGSVTTQLNPETAMAPTGGNLPHNNKMPYLGLTFIIALQGVFPARG